MLTPYLCSIEYTSPVLDARIIAPDRFRVDLAPDVVTYEMHTKLAYRNNPGPVAAVQRRSNLPLYQSTSTLDPFGAIPSTASSAVATLVKSTSIETSSHSLTLSGIRLDVKELEFNARYRPAYLCGAALISSGLISLSIGDVRRARGGMELRIDFDLAPASLSAAPSATNSPSSLLHGIVLRKTRVQLHHFTIQLASASPNFFVWLWQAFLLLLLAPILQPATRKGLESVLERKIEAGIGQLNEEIDKVNKRMAREGEGLAAAAWAVLFQGDSAVANGQNGEHHGILDNGVDVQIDGKGVTLGLGASNGDDADGVVVGIGAEGVLIPDLPSAAPPTSEDECNSSTTKTVGVSTQQVGEIVEDISDAVTSIPEQVHKEQVKRGWKSEAFTFSL